MPWIKHALLFWDEVRFLQPMRMEITLSGELKEANEASLLTPIHVDMQDDRITTSIDSFITEYRESLLAISFDIKKITELTNLLHHHITAYSKSPITYAILEMNHESYSNVIEVLQRIKQLSRSRGTSYAMTSDELTDQLTASFNILLHFYSIVRIVSENSSIDTVCTNNNADFLSNPILLFNDKKASPYSAKKLLVDLQIPFPTIENIESIPLQKIIRFHEKHQSSKRRFRSLVTDMTEIVRSAKNEDHFRDLLSDMKGKVKEVLEEQEHSLKAFRVNTVWSLIKTGGISSLIGHTNTHFLGDAVFPGLGIAGGMMIGLAKSIVDIQSNHRALTQNDPMHYLLQLPKLK